MALEEQATQQLAEILGRITKLPAANLEPPQFFAHFLQLSVAATGSEGGALWLLQAGQSPKCYCHIDIELSQIDKSEPQRQLLTQAIQKVVSSSQYLVVPGGNLEISPTSLSGDAGHVLTGNTVNRPFFFKPLRAANQVAMILQMIGPEHMDPNRYRMVVAVLEQVGETAESYLAHRRAAVLEDDRKTLARLLQYAEGVHDSLDPETIVYQMANRGREAIGCSRVIVWVDPDVKKNLRAVSGVDKPDHRAVLMQSIEKLSRKCIELKKPVLASRDQLKELPEEEELTSLLRDYFNASQLNQIYLYPFEDKEKKLIGTIVAEGFDQDVSANLAGVVGQAAKHGSLALQHALEVASLPLVRPLARFKKSTSDPHKKRKMLIRVGVAAFFLILGALVPWTIRINCPCELTPETTRVIDSPLEGVQIDRILIPSGPVKKGDVIARLNDTELKSQLLTYQADQRKAAVELKQQSQQLAERKYIELQIERLQSQIDLVQWQIDQCQVRSPIDGVILTPQLETREGMTLKRGDVICEVAELNRWQLLLNVPQEDIGWVQRGLEKKSGNDGLDVVFFLAAYPENKIETSVKDYTQISYLARVKQDGNFFEIRTNVPEDQLVPIHSGLRSGSTGRAKIDTVSRPLIYVLLRKVIRFWNMTFF
jgi:hypothetical protein